jgi:hypothetical protein
MIGAPLLAFTSAPIKYRFTMSMATFLSLSSSLPGKRSREYCRYTKPLHHSAPDYRPSLLDSSPWHIYGTKCASAGTMAHLVSQRAGSLPLMPISIRYRWRYYDEARGRHFVTRYWCEEAFIRIQHPEAVQVPGSEQRLDVPDDIRTNSTGRFGQGHP